MKTAQAPWRKYVQNKLSATGAMSARGKIATSNHIYDGEISIDEQDEDCLMVATPSVYKTAESPFGDHWRIGVDSIEAISFGTEP